MESPYATLSETSVEDWANTPESVKQLVQRLLERIEPLEAGQQALQEQIKRNSKNSSQLPSQDPPKGFNVTPKKKSGKRRGGQPGHQGHSQELYPRNNVRASRTTTLRCVANDGEIVDSCRYGERQRPLQCLQLAELAMATIMLGAFETGFHPNC